MKHQKLHVKKNDLCIVTMRPLLIYYKVISHYNFLVLAFPITYKYNFVRYRNFDKPCALNEISLLFSKMLWTIDYTDWTPRQSKKKVTTNSFNLVTKLLMFCMAKFQKSKLTFSLNIIIYAVFTAFKKYFLYLTPSIHDVM